MMTTNEWLRGALEDGLNGARLRGGGEEEQPFHFATILLSGMGAGGIASAATAPLDRIKTRLQTQRMGMATPAASGPGAAIAEERALAAARGEPKVCPRMAVEDARRAFFPDGAPPARPPSVSRAVRPAPTTPFRAHYPTPS